jgi:Fe-S cluster assembly protein SufD
MTTLVDFPVKPEARPYLEAARERAGEPEWLAQLRRRNLARFAEQGFPSRRGEAWRYLDLRPLEAAPLLPIAAKAALPRTILDRAGLPNSRHRLVLVDGRFAPELSALAGFPAGLTLGSAAALPERLRDALESPATGPDRSFAALNTAFFTDGFVLEAAPGTILDEPIEILHLASGAASGSLHTRSLVALGKGSRAQLVESFVGEGRYWRNDVVAVELGAGAVLGRVVLVDEAADAMHFGDLSATLGRASRLDNFTLLLGGRTLRHEMAVRIEGDGAHCGLQGGFLASDRQEANFVTTVEHMAEGGETREVFKGVAAGRAHGAFQGRITVRPGAQKTDAHMLSRNLLLGHRAAIDTKPELEIFADDVKCSHGAAVGDLDETALFYLLARGIPREAARRMLIEAFISEAVETVEPPSVREHLMARLARRLDALEE